MADPGCYCEQLDQLVSTYLQGSGQATEVQAPDEAVRQLLLAGDFAAAAQRLASLCPALAENQWLQFQLKRHNFLLLAARAAAPSSEDDGSGARARQLQAALDLAKRELAPLALHAYCEAYSDFKHCMLALLAHGDSAAEAETDLRQFAGMVARALRQELAGAGGASAPSSPPQLLQLLRYLLLLHKHQHHCGFHPYWWPKVSSASQSLCSRLLLPGRDALPPPELDTIAQDGYGSLPPGVQETDVQALRTSLGCDREEAVTLLRRARGSAPRALQDALQAVHVDEALLRQLADEYAASRGLEPLPASSSAAAEAMEEEMQTDAQQQGGAQQQVVSPGKADRLRQAKVGSKRSAPVAAEDEAEAGGGQALELPAELSEHQLRRVLRRLERLLSAGQADEALQELEDADPAFLPDHPAAAFALHRCRFLQHLSASGGTAAALAVVRQDLSRLAQKEPELQPQLKAALTLLLPLPAASGGGRDAVAVKRQQQGVADALTALRAALRPRCHVREPQLLGLLRELLSLHQAHFKLQRCQDRFASELGLSALVASAPAPASTAAVPSTRSLLAAVIAVEAQEALAAAGQVPVPSVRELSSESEGDEMDEDSEEEEFADDGAGVPESAIVTVCEFTGLPRHTAIELLLVHGGDPAAVLAQMFP